MPRKLRSHSRQSGEGVVDALKTVGQFVRDQKLISKGLGLIPHPGAQAASQIAKMVGLGEKKKKKKAKKPQHGGSFFSDLGGGIGNVFGGLGGGIGNVARGLFGGSRAQSQLLKV